MAKHYKFGMSVEEVQTKPEHPDFDVYSKSTSSDQERPNPYGKAWFDDPKNMSKVERSAARITSIPSPYARMHITDLAFRELNSGSSTMSESDMMGKVISKDYLHAMSHCLDMFELFYYFDDLDLKEKGIRIEKIDLVNPNDPAVRDFLRKNPQTKGYLETLQLFRNQYLKALDKNRPGNYKFHFDALYVFWDDVSNTVIGATSPFTGFFAKSTCNVLTDSPTPEARLTIRKGDYVHNLLTNNPNDWITLRNRPDEFKKFLYLLLHKNTENLGVVFANLFKTVEMSIGKDMIEKYNSLSFSQEYPEFNFGDEELPKILSGKDAYLRVSDLDRSFLKYLLYLYLDNPINFDIPKDAYEKPIDQREFPDGSGHSVPWICVNDLLSDALFVLPYDVNKRYVAVTYYDKETKKEYRRCLLPIKQRVLEYFPDQSLADIAKNLTIVKYEDGHFVVNYKVKMEKKDRAGNPVYINLRREYKPRHYEYPNGILIGPDMMNDFAFGIYPFVRSESYTNIYKVLFYNKFGLSISAKQPEVHLDFYYFSVNASKNEKRPMQFKKDSVKENYTGTFNSSYADKTLNSLYYSIQEENETNRTKCIEFAELCMDIKDELGNVVTKGTSLIVPKLEGRETRDDVVTHISIDLGTSNTYVAYKRDDETAPREINTIHVDKDNEQYSELQFMSEPASNDDFADVKAKYGHDLYLRPSKEPQRGDNESADEYAERLKKLWTACMPTQFCEFIPAHIVPRPEVQRNEFKDKAMYRKGSGFSFPIPTVINCLQMNGSPVQIEQGNDVDSVLKDNQPLTHSSIPFAYYEIGKRPSGDTIAEGDFKWFMNENERIPRNELNLTMFVSELLFIVRSNMLSEGFALDRCRLLWTYPLAFNRTLKDNTADIWKKAYKKYFTNGDVTDEELDEKVKSTNESLSPFYECVPGADRADFTILMDIGGGSTDIIGYDNNEAQFITSFEFAGNALYLNSKRNHPYRTDEKNVFTYYLDKDGSCQEMKNSQKKSYFGDATRLITGALNTSNGLAALMNYGFQMYERDFKLLFLYPEIQFMLQFYAASIVYHTAQLCHWYSKTRFEERHTGDDSAKNGDLPLPHFVYLSGNGSKLLNLLGVEERDRLFEQVFLKVYGKDYLGEEELKIKTPSNPKVATARGALKAPDEVFNSHSSRCVIMLGDENTVHKRGRNNQPFEVLSNQDKVAMLKSVRTNVEKFIDVFYEYLGTGYPLVPKKTVLLQLDAVEKQEDVFRIGERVTDSYFFLYIARVMEKISQRLVDKLEEKRS